MLPATCGDYGILPHANAPYPASLDEIYEHFVVGAPYADQRRELWDVFPAYVRKARAYFPTCRILLDGGFVTHKNWEAPEDIDIALGIDRLEYNALQDWERAQLFNSVSATGHKVKVMGGAIDASRFDKNIPALFAKWHDDWSSVRGPNRLTLPGVRKGYVEVTA